MAPSLRPTAPKICDNISNYQGHLTLITRAIRPTYLEFKITYQGLDWPYISTR